MQIRGTEWYTALRTYSDEKGNQVSVYGYRMPVQGRDSRELKEFIALLKADGVDVKLRVSSNSHLGIPAGTPFIQVLDDESAIALEKIFLKQGIELPTDRYKEYGMEYINRTPKAELAPVVKKSFFDRLFGRK